MLFAFLLFLPVISCELKEFIKWKQLHYQDLPNSDNTSFFNQYNNVPQGFFPYNDKVFVTVPRRNIGVPSTLNYVQLNGDKEDYENPPLISYPNFATNELDPLQRPDPNRIVSVYRPRVDTCDRLWFVDTGVLEYPGNMKVIQAPSIWIMDLKTDKLINRYEIPSEIVDNGYGLASLVIDVIDCSRTFAYLPDLQNYRLIVYSFAENKAWRFIHNYFHLNPFEGDYNVNGFQFSWDDGIFSITLGESAPDSYRLAYFHPLSSDTEFHVSTRILRNETLATRGYHGNDFHYLGTRGPLSNSGTHFYDKSTNVLFFTEMQKNSMTCWNAKSPMMPSNIHNVHKDDTKLIYPADLNIDNESTIWLISNRLPRFIYSRLDTNIFNFHIWRENVNDALAGTQCLG
ncbi:unnamed protein product [Diamesa hyperborea]